MTDSSNLAKWVLGNYNSLVQERHPTLVDVWPLLSGYNVKYGEFDGRTVFIFVSTGMPGFVNSSDIGDLSVSLVGANSLTDANREQARVRIEAHHGVGSRGAVIFLEPNGDLNSGELEVAIRKHEHAMGLTPMKIFLSHKGTDKHLVRDFDKTLKLMGFDTWLDEDAMAAGTDLERAILKGIADSCAVVFFVTKNYLDEDFLASEVTYATMEKRRKKDKFAIITIAFDDAGKEQIPALLHQYVWKTPSTHLEALREIIKALPIKVGEVYWR